MPLRKRILCIEPVPDICGVVQTMLREQGYETDTADTIAEAVAKAESGDYCLYIVDDKYEDGLSPELIRRLRLVTPLAPIIAFSAYAFGRDRQEALEAGASVFLAKPDGILKLTEIVSRLLTSAPI